ncbi:carboxylesterase family protein [Sphingomonas sp. KR3-1]|uniref:carboxylesterase/lipase family protein n=1 Tax=Sphingomonas sp. KR3-1 TaxID=3156611 RepID=UPI0032B53465
MMGIAHRFAALGLALAGTAAVNGAEAQSIVKAPAGSVRGVQADGQKVFKGIPYALPPVGERRWKPPVAVPAWAGVHDATAFGPACQQPPAPPSSIYAETYPAMSEDCLSLNIWAPAGAKKAPVFVWIHGGNLVRGSSQQAMFAGDNLARRGVIVVSINYRLGVFGYFAHPGLSAESPDGTSGNYGVMDQIAALRWVRANIAAFGGDAGNVTIAGESAGGLAILHLLAAPQARGLFSKAIVQSAALMNIPDLKEMKHGVPSAEALGVHYAGAIGAKTVAELRAIPGPDLAALAAKAGFASTAIVDGKVLPRQLIETFERGEQAHVPLMTGFTAGEISTMKSILPGLPEASTFTPASYEAKIRASYGEFADTFLRLYPSSDIGKSMLAAARDGFFAWNSQRLVRDQAKAGQPTYLYYFDHGYPAADAAGIHAFHASEVPYMFGTIDRVTSLWPAIPQTEAERSLSDAMVGYWASFARSGTPSAAGQPAWAPHNRDAAYMLFSDKPHAAANLKPEEYALNDEIICRRRAAGNIPWNWNMGVISPPLPPAVETCK